jgi:hypothetical protein
LLCIPLLLFPYFGLPLQSEIALLWGVAAFAVAGGLAGRSGIFAMAALALTFIGGFVGYAVFFGLAFSPANLLFAAIHGLVAGVAGWAAAKRKFVKIKTEVLLENEEKRRCKMCGVRVGLWAKKCWSCRASLARLT